jgi:hypothetical protein
LSHHLDYIVFSGERTKKGNILSKFCAVYGGVVG